MASAQSFDPVPIAELITNPATHAGQNVVVEGVVRVAQWTTTALPGRGPDLVPMVPLGDGTMGIWVVLIGVTNLGAARIPPIGTSVRVYGTFRAGTRAIETDPELSSDDHAPLRRRARQAATRPCNRCGAHVPVGYSYRLESSGAFRAPPVIC